jgi:hypothetical protein
MHFTFADRDIYKLLNGQSGPEALSIIKQGATNSLQAAAAYITTL